MKNRIGETVIDLHETEHDFLILTKSSNIYSLSYFNKIIKKGHTQDFTNEPQVMEIYNAIKAVLK